MARLLKGVWGTWAFRGKCLAISLLLSAVTLVVVPLIVQAQPDDGDGDLIPDVFESLLGLDPTDPSDATQDPDGDTVTNLGEYNAFSDPMLKDSDFDGLKDALDPDPLSSAMFYWGRANLSSSDNYSYIVPQWITGATKIGGSWTHNSWFLPSAQTGQLRIGTENVPGDLFLDMAFVDIGDISVRWRIKTRTRARPNYQASPRTPMTTRPSPSSSPPQNWPHIRLS